MEKNERITLFLNNYHLSRDYVRCWFNMLGDEFCKEHRRHPAKELSYELISQRCFAKRRRDFEKARLQ